MTSEVVHFTRRADPELAAARARLDSLSSIFRAIEEGELLAALPDCPLARANHLAALNLLSLAEMELRYLYLELTEVAQ